MEVRSGAGSGRSRATWGETIALGGLPGTRLVPSPSRPVSVPVPSGCYGRVAGRRQPSPPQIEVIRCHLSSVCRGECVPCRPNGVSATRSNGTGEGSLPKVVVRAGIPSATEVD